MAVIHYAVKTKSVAKPPTDPKRIRLSYDMILAPTKELHISDSLMEFLTKHSVTEVATMFKTLQAQTPEQNTGMLNIRPDNELACNYYALRRGGEPVISFLPYAKVKEAKGNEWARKGRQTMKPGKFLNTIFTDEALTKFKVLGPSVSKGAGAKTVLERFTKQIEAYVDVRAKMIECSGEAIEYWYSPHRYSPSAGTTLVQSCMNKDEFEAPKFRLYTQHPSLKLLVAVDKEYKLMGRALLWRNVQLSEVDDMGRKLKTSKTVTFMDRVYAGEDFVEEAFIAMAQKEGWYRREFTRHDYQIYLVDPSNKPLKGYMQVESGLKAKLPVYPYVDTFKWASNDLKWLYNYKPVGEILVDLHSENARAEKNQAYLVNTEIDGDVPIYDVVKCVHCKKTGNLHNMSALEYTLGNYDRRICRRCQRDYYLFSNFEQKWIPMNEGVGVAFADGNKSDTVSKGNAVYSKHHGLYLIKAYARYVKLSDDWVMRSADIVPSSFHDSYIFRVDAIWVPELDSFVHRNHMKEAEEAIAALKTQTKPASQTKNVEVPPAVPIPELNVEPEQAEVLVQAVMEG